MRSIVLLLSIVTLVSCEKDESAAAHLLGASKEVVDGMVRKDMTIKEVHQVIGSPTSSGDFLGELKEDYEFFDDFPNFPPSGTLIGISVYYKGGFVTRWTGHYQGGVYEKEQDGTSTKTN